MSKQDKPKRPTFAELYGGPEKHKILSDDDVIEQRKIALKMVRDAAAKGNAIAGMLSELERYAAPFYLDVDGDPDGSDMDVFP